MSEQPRLTNAWVHSPTPPPSIMDPWLAEVWTNGARFVVAGPTRQAVQDRLLAEHPELVGCLRWVFETPPQPRRSEPKPSAPAVEADSIPFTALAKRFHPDRCGKRKFDAGEIMRLLLELRDELKAKP